MGVVIKLLTRPGIELHFVGRPDSSLVTVPTAMSWDGVRGKCKETLVDLSMRLLLQDLETERSFKVVQMFRQGIGKLNYVWDTFKIDNITDDNIS